MAGAANARLHLVKNQQRIVVITELAQAIEKLGVARHHAAFTLNRLYNHRAGFFLRDKFLYRLQIVEVCMMDAARRGLKTLKIFGLTAHTHGEQGAPVECIFKGDDFVFFRP